MREIATEYLEEMLRDRVGARIRRGDELVSLGAERAIVVRRVRLRPQGSNLARGSLAWAFQPRRVMIEIAVTEGRIVERAISQDEASAPRRAESAAPRRRRAR